MFCSDDLITTIKLSPAEGFGMQYSFIINTILFAEKFNKTFVYTPFQALNHNYENDSDFLIKKEKLINLVDHFPINRDLGLTYKKYLGISNIHLAGSETLKTVKKLFFWGKNKEKFFSNDFSNVAIHIRRTNPCDVLKLYRPDHDIPFYYNLINLMRDRMPQHPTRYHIYSQGNRDEFKVLESQDVFLHINETLEDTFSAMAFADVLVPAFSCLSYTAGFLSNGLVLYFPNPDGYIPLFYEDFGDGSRVQFPTPGLTPLADWRSIRDWENVIN